MQLATQLDVFSTYLASTKYHIHSTQLRLANFMHSGDTSATLVLLPAASHLVRLDRTPHGDDRTVVPLRFQSLTHACLPNTCLPPAARDAPPVDQLPSQWTCTRTPAATAAGFLPPQLLTLASLTAKVSPTATYPSVLVSLPSLPYVRSRSTQEPVADLLPCKPEQGKPGQVHTIPCTALDLVPTAPAAPRTPCQQQHRTLCMARHGCKCR